jgi:hypothetical protein
MRKNFTSLLFLFSLFVCLVISSGVVSQSNSKDEDAGVESVTLKDEKIIFCPWSRKTEGYCSKQQSIEVSVKSPKAEKEGLDYLRWSSLNREKTLHLTSIFQFPFRFKFHWTFITQT